MAPSLVSSCNLSSPFLFHLGACETRSLPRRLDSLRSSPCGRFRLWVDRGMESANKGEGSRKASSAKRWRTYSGDLIGAPGVSSPSPSNIPLWVWALGSLVILALPFYRTIFAKRGEIEKVAEEVVEAVEKIAEVTERVASEVANVLPDGVGLKEEILLVEKIAHKVDKDAKLVEAIAHQVDHAKKEEVGAVVEPSNDGEEKTEKVEGQGSKDRPNANQ